MGNKTFLYIGAGILLLIGLCLFGYGILNIIGSTSAQGSDSWFGFGIGFSVVDGLPKTKALIGVIVVVLILIAIQSGFGAAIANFG